MAVILTLRVIRTIIPGSGMDRRGSRLARSAFVLGAAASVALALLATHRVHSPASLRGLFAVWVLAPFALIAAALSRSAAWPAPVRRTLAAVAAICGPVSAVAYGIVALGPARPRAPVFVLLPPISVLVAAIAVLIAALAHRGAGSPDTLPQRDDR
jgi:hypothetical protein